MASDPACLHYGQALAHQFGATLEVDYNWDDRHLEERRRFWVERRLCKGQWTGRETEEEYTTRACDRLDDAANSSEHGRLVVVTKEVMVQVTKEEWGLACLEYSDRLEVVFSMKPEEFPYNYSEQIGLISAASSSEEAESLANFILCQSCIQSQAWTTVFSSHPQSDPLAQAVAHSLGVDLHTMEALKAWEPDKESKEEYEERLLSCLSELRGTEMVTVDSTVYLTLTNHNAGISVLSDSKQREIIDFVPISVSSITLICGTEFPVSVMAALLYEKLPTSACSSWAIQSCSHPSCVSLAQSIANQYGVNSAVNYQWDDQHMIASPEPVHLQGVQYPTEWFGSENSDQFQGRLGAIKAFAGFPQLVCVGKQVFSALTGTAHAAATLRQFSDNEWEVRADITLEEVQMALAAHYAGLIVQQVTTALNTAVSTTNYTEIYREIEEMLTKEISILLIGLESKYEAALQEANRALQAEIRELRTELEQRNQEIANITVILKQNLSDSLENISRFEISSPKEHWEANLQSLEMKFEGVKEQFQRFYSLLPSSQLPLTIQKVDGNWEITTKNHQLYRIEGADLWAESEEKAAEKLLEGASLLPGLSKHTLPVLSSFSPSAALQLVWKQHSAFISPVLTLHLHPKSSLSRKS